MKKKTKPKKRSKKTKKKSGFKKGVFITLIAIILIIGIGITYVLTNLNFIVKTAIEKYGSESTKTAVRVGSVKIRLKNGEAAIHNLTIANPKGFEGKHAFSLGEAAVKIQIKSLTQDVKVIDEIIIRAIQIDAEINKDRKNNLNEIKKNLASTAPAKPKTENESKQPAKEPRLIIRHFSFTQGSIRSRVIPINKEYQLILPPFELRNIGGKSGATPEEITKQVLTELTNRALAQIQKTGIEQGKGYIQSQLKNEEKNTKKKLKGLLKN